MPPVLQMMNLSYPATVYGQLQGYSKEGTNKRHVPKLYPPLTPLGRPEKQRINTVSFDTPTKNVDRRSKLPGSASRYPRSPSDPLTARGTRRSRIPATTKQSKAPVTRLFSNIASKLAPTHTEDTKFTPPMAPKTSTTEVAPQRFQPELYPTHSRDTSVLRPYSPPLDGPQYSPTFESRPNTPLFSQTSPPSSASFEI